MLRQWVLIARIDFQADDTQRNPLSCNAKRSWIPPPVFFDADFSIHSITHTLMGLSTCTDSSCCAPLRRKRRALTITARLSQWPEWRRGLRKPQLRTEKQGIKQAKKKDTTSEPSQTSFSPGDETEAKCRTGITLSRSTMERLVRLLKRYQV